MIEVELRSFITKEKYEELLDYFNKNSKLIKEDEQITYYFSGEKDLRIQKNRFFSKIWLKSGKIHDEAREEIEIKMPVENFEESEKLFIDLGYEIEIKWFRKRNQFDWEGVEVSIDYTKGYGYIIKLEKRIEGESEKEKSLGELKQRFEELGIKITPKEKFDEAYESYKKNWRELIEEDF